MPHLRRLLEIFVAITILTLTVPSLNWQDNRVDNGDASQSSDNSGDPSADQAAGLGDFVPGESSILYSPFQYELLSMSIQEDFENFPASISYSVPFLPHLFISESGLMPRAPALA